MRFDFRGFCSLRALRAAGGDRCRNRYGGIEKNEKVLLLLFINILFCSSPGRSRPSPYLFGLLKPDLRSLSPAYVCGPSAPVI